MISNLEPSIRIIGDVVGHTSKVEVRVDDTWHELPVTAAEVRIRPGDLTVCSLELVRVETYCGLIRLDDATLGVLAAILREHGYVVTAADEDGVEDLLLRLRQWDHMETAADGPYWIREIDRVLGKDAA